MALGATLHTVGVHLADADRGVHEGRPARARR